MTALALVPKQVLTRDEVYSRDRNKIINAACGIRCKQYLRPAEALEDIVRIMKFQPVRRFCRQSFTDLPNREIVISTLEHTLAAYRWRLACEIGHIRLHLFDGVVRLGPHHRAEAELYARIFLMPEDEVRKSVKFRATEEWLSTDFGVSMEAVRLRLAELNLTASKPRKRSSGAQQRKKKTEVGETG